jgi:hypothetical protein
MEQPKVFIYIPDYWESEKRALDRLVISFAIFRPYGGLII